MVTPLSYSDYAYGVAIQSDGRIVAVGRTYNGDYSDFAVVRWNADGSLDTTFGTNGTVTTDFSGANDCAYGAIIRSNTLVVVGSAFNSDNDVALARYFLNNPQLTVTVNNVAPTLTVVGDQSVSVDDNRTLNVTDLGTFTDPGFTNPAAGTSETFTYSIDWGDGSNASTGSATVDATGSVGVATQGSFDGSHTYGSAGYYTVTATITDDDGGSDTKSFYVTVSAIDGYVWKGGGGDDYWYWTNGDNWVGGLAPPTGAVNLIFSGTATDTFNDFPAGTAFGSIEFVSSGFSISGNAVALTGNTIILDTGVTSATITTDAALHGPLPVGVTDDDATLTLSGSLSGSNYLEKTGGGTLILSGDNTYSGGTTIEDGTLQLENANALIASGNGLLVDGPDAVLDLNGYSPTVGAVGLINGSIINSSAIAATLTGSSYVVMNGTISTEFDGNTAPLIKGTSGTVAVNGQNTYGGLTTVYAGELDVGPDARNPILSGGGVDLQDGKLVLGCTNGTDGDTLRSTVQADLLAGYNGTPKFAAGQIHSSTAASTGTALGLDDTISHQLTIARAIYGDANLDGKVSLLDLATVGANWNRTGMVWADGDFDYNGTVNLLDLAILGSNWNLSRNPLPPQVIEIARLGPADTNANTVQFVVVFSKDVAGVDATDFGRVDTAAGCAEVTSVVGYGGSGNSQAVYLVTVENIIGNGTLGLNLIDDNTIVDSNGNHLNHTGFDGQGRFIGQTYTISSPYVWDGGGNDGDWATVENWAGNIVPGSGDSVLFAGSAQTAVDIDGAAFSSIEIASSGFVLAAGATETMSADVVLDNSVTFDVAAGTTLTLSGTVSGPGGIIKTGNGRLILDLIPVNYFVLHTKMAVFWALLRFRCKPTCCFQVKKDETHASTIWCPFSRCFVRCS